MKLLKDKVILSGELSKAEGWWQRLRGLLARKSMGPLEGLWIPGCRSIHCFGMKFSIDAVFINDRMQVVALCRDLNPGDWVAPICHADSVLEFNTGTIEKWNLKLGDVLNVEP